MGQAHSAATRGYAALSQDDPLGPPGMMTSQEYHIRAQRAIDTVRALPDEYATAEDRAAAIAAVYTGRGDKEVLARVSAGIRRWRQDDGTTASDTTANKSKDD
ncbi:hypothetical protein pkur_cds_732 [Pandoravirus kuranda]|uniref:Uncharacterized protein n=1 Tax=Pandoravirus kuranda TaxID=3019033 RepID=A0AA95ENM5_9VIRU|nr:hypothetical protein pkur_cds_732 [Pandoravirus kuranda]